MIRPSIDPAEIEARYDAVAELSKSSVVAEQLASSFDGIFDLERLLSRITIGTAGPRELASLRSSIGRLPGHQRDFAETESRSFCPAAFPTGSS